MKNVDGKARTRSLERPKCRWVDNIKIHLREIGMDDMGWIALAQGRGQ
jgi:hypothetical protein